MTPSSVKAARFIHLALLLGLVASYRVEKHIFHAVVDHYSFRPTKYRTFPLRFYIHDQNWDGKGPCFFYAGNEANIFQFVNNSGFMFEAAAEFGALVVFAEHRYYGESIIPGGDMSFLTVEQAIADFNTLSVHIRNQWNMTSDVAFVAFGGSYGANLAMWLRLRNPNLWAGAIASSATPLKHLLRETNGFTRIETEAYGNVSAQCPELIRLGWRELYDGASSCGGRTDVAKVLGLCSPLPDNAAADDVHGWISGALETMVQYGYPYPSTFYNAVPAYPFREACQQMVSTGTGLGALRAAVNVYYNHTGQAGDCFDFGSFVAVEATKHWTRKGDRSQVYLQKQRFFETRSPGERLHLRKEPAGSRRLLRSYLHLTEDDAWGYQTCTEVYQPMPTNGVSDFELPLIPNQTAYYEDCMQRFGVQPRPDWEEMAFMGADISAGSNIFLTSGQLDPWRAAGIQGKPKGSPDSIIVRIIENGAHHLDLRGSHPLDPSSVIAVRQEEKAAIREWVAQWKVQSARSFSSKGTHSAIVLSHLCEYLVGMREESRSNRPYVMAPPPAGRKRGVLALVTGRLPKFSYDPDLLDRTTRWMRRRGGKGRPSEGALDDAYSLEEYDPCRSEFTLFFLADALSLNTIRFRPILVDFLQSQANEDLCQCVCVPNGQGEVYLCHGTGFACLPWEHENRGGILRLLAATQVPSVIVVHNATGRRITDKGMQAIESNDPKDVVARWGRQDSGVTVLQNVATVCSLS